MVVLATSEFIAAVRGFADRPASERVALDALGVFPVADADTGSNITRSVEAVVAALGAVVDVAAPGEVAGLVADEAANSSPTLISDDVEPLLERSNEVGS